MKFLNKIGVQYLWNTVNARLNALAKEVEIVDEGAYFLRIKKKCNDGEDVNKFQLYTRYDGDDQAVIISGTTVDEDGNASTWSRFVADAVMLNALSNRVDAVDATAAGIGDLSALTTTAKTDLVNALNEVKAQADAPFKVKKWSADVNVEIPYCTEDISNASIPKMTFKIEGQEAVDYQVVGMVAYEVFDTNGTRVNCWPVCQFTGQNTTELSVRWMCGGTTRKTATRIVSWVLLMHR